MTTLTVILIVATVGLLGQAYYYRRAGSPRPVIVYRLARLTPLVAGQLLRDAAGEVVVSFKGEEVSEPHLAELVVESRSRRDIDDDDFYRQKPLVFDFGARIITVLGGYPDKTTVSPHAIATDGTKLRVGPCLIRSGPVLNVEVLTEGRPTLECKDGDNPSRTSS